MRFGIMSATPLSMAVLSRSCTRTWDGEYQPRAYISTLADNGFIQSMSRKGNCIDNGATEQVFGHLKDEFFRGQDCRPSRASKPTSTPTSHWSTTRRQVKLKGLTPAEYRDQALQEAA